MKSINIKHTGLQDQPFNETLGHDNVMKIESVLLRIYVMSGCQDCLCHCCPEGTQLQHASV